MLQLLTPNLAMNSMLSPDLHDSNYIGRIIFESDVEERTEGNPPSENKILRKRNRATTSRKRSATAPYTSYVKSKSTSRPHHLIKIEVFDLMESEETNSGDSVLSAQYVVTDVVDDIFDSTETLVRKISKRISENVIDL